MDLKQKTLFCLQKHPETRNSDIALTEKIWWEFHNSKIKEFDGEKYVKIKDMYELPREDNVKRIRAKIQNEEHKFLPTNDIILKQRGLLAEKWRLEMMPSNTARY
jgi:hypothetical protein